MNKKENGHLFKSHPLFLCVSALLIVIYTSLRNIIIIEENPPPVPVPCVRYLCPYWKGRLGNQMFEYASLYGIAKENNMKLVVTESDKVFKIFNMSNRVHAFSDHMRKTLCRNTTTLSFPRSATFVKVVIPQVKFVKIDGHIQSWKYFKRVEKKVRHQFVFKQNIKDQAQLLLKRVVGSGYVTVGVHIRRGDMLNHYPVANRKYLQIASNYFRSRYKKVIFIVCTSPDKETRAWTLRNFIQIYNNDSILMDNAPPEVDMCLLSSCDHTIITVGSFGWWVGWLNSGTTIYYDFFDHTNNYTFTKNDYIYPGWIGIKT